MKHDSIPNISDLKDLEALREKIVEIERSRAELKESYNSLLQSERRYQHIVDLLPEIVFELDLDGKLTFVNKVGWESSGFTQEDIDKGIFVGDLVIPEDKEKFKKNIHRLLAGEETGGNEYTLLAKDGRLIRLLIHASPIINKNVPVGIRGIAYNINKFKKAQDDLRDSEERYRLLLELSIDAVYMMVDGKFEFVNDRFVEMFGWSEEEILAPDFDWWVLVAPRSRPLIEDRLEILRQGKIPPNRYEFTAMTKDGREMELEVSLSYLTFKGKEVIQGIYHDITERKAAIKATFESEERYRAIYENSPVGICLTDQDGVYQYVNRAYCEIYGFKEDELVGKKFYDLIIPAERIENSADRHRVSFDQKKGSPVGEAQFLKKNGERIWVQFTSDFVRLGGKPIYKVAMNIDITEKKAAEKEAQQSKDRFEAQFKRQPLPSYSWQKNDDDFILIDYNDAADEIVNGQMKGYLGTKATDLYRDNSKILDDLKRCFEEQSVINEELLYFYRSTREKRHLSVRYVFIPPDHVLVHTEDITIKKINEIRNKARLHLLNGLRNAGAVDECLQLGCQAIADADLYSRAVLTLHNESREIVNLGQVGLDKRIVEAVRNAPAPDSDLKGSMLQDKFRINNSYFIPCESSLPINKTPRHIAQTANVDQDNSTWRPGDELFVPIIGDADRVEGWLSVDTPVDGQRPTEDVIIFLEEIVDIVIKKIYGLQRLEDLKKERQALEEANIALREVLANIEQDRIKFRNQIGENVNQALLPALKKLIGNDGNVNRAFLNLLEAGLKDLGTLDSKSRGVMWRLSARELEICNMIKTGAASKEIADALHVSLGTVQKHREKIRKKLELTGKQINLANYLKGL